MAKSQEAIKIKRLDVEKVMDNKIKELHYWLGDNKDKHRVFQKVYNLLGVAEWDHNSWHTYDELLDYSKFIWEIYAETDLTLEQIFSYLNLLAFSLNIKAADRKYIDFTSKIFIKGDCLATGKTVNPVQCYLCYISSGVNDVASWESCRKYNLWLRGSGDDQQ
ncbi:MAG: hypothetical protein PWR10_1560 [Halanaerobiales bacterium]|nr:hypothetical protein [Halanaerobiales bacterium]